METKTSPKNLYRNSMKALMFVTIALTVYCAVMGVASGINVFKSQDAEKLLITVANTLSDRGHDLSDSPKSVYSLGYYDSSDFVLARANDFHAMAHDYQGQANRYFLLNCLGILMVGVLYYAYNVSKHSKKQEDEVK